MPLKIDWHGMAKEKIVPLTPPGSQQRSARYTVRLPQLCLFAI
ncbi:hypothetical protein SAMN04487951_111112 [Vreelandella arcis]|uniref:Uncharacterized protein n=1 Tax=Vreelandella arcis TaxID=416873 RepID=A0A1H0G6R3_9GAMM|nr:hypothetical protein SAMN04487951_111112 [Halomonas arcis]